MQRRTGGRNLGGMFLTDPPQSPQSDAMFEVNRESDGYVTNFTRLWCWRPDLFKAFVDLRLELMGSTTLTEREQAIVVAATVSAFGDSYCSLAWGSKLAKLAGDETAGRVIAGALPGDLSAREAALCEWCRTVAHDPMTTAPEQVERRARPASTSARSSRRAAPVAAGRVLDRERRPRCAARPPARRRRAEPRT